MQRSAGGAAGPVTPRPDLAGLRVLVVDDSLAQRRLVLSMLSPWGCVGSEAASAEVALALLARDTVDVIICDWMMPGLSGPDFCRQFRQQESGDYSYFILLTSKSDRGAIALALEAGADDFVTKPLGPDELRARLRAGQRIVTMQAELRRKNRQVERTLQQLQRLYDTLDRDLAEAGKLQSTLVRERSSDFGRARVDLMLCPAGHVGGDLVGCMALDDRRLAVWSVDVSGHGVASAMMTARLAGFLSAATPAQNLAFATAADGSRILRGPAEVLAAFNRLMLEELQVEQYFTMVYAELNMDSGALRLAQAGHPHPMVLRRDGRIAPVGAGGLPIGLIAGARHEECHLRLRPGDRLLLMSDGVTECCDHSGAELGEAGVSRLLAGLAALPGARFVESLSAALTDYAKGATRRDDISGLLMEYRADGIVAP